MKTWDLLITPDGRRYIDTSPIGVTAPTWIAAKEALGFPLTPTQRAILEGKATTWSLFGRSYDLGPAGGKPRVVPKAKVPDATAQFLASIGDEIAAMIETKAPEAWMFGQARLGVTQEISPDTDGTSSVTQDIESAIERSGCLSEISPDMSETVASYQG